MSGILFAVSAFVLGALHALEPGHGKTVVAAYLVGSKGTVRDAVLLGGIVTFTHTFSIIVLGLLTAVASAYLVPETVHEVLEVVSGLLVVAVGLWMVRGRLLVPRSDHGHSHGEHEHASAHHDHDHAPDPDHPHAHSHQHGADGHHGHSHTLPEGQRPSLGGLVTLGISGGMVPCPAALALLLAAVAVGNVLGGVSLVIVFSLGLAVVLIAIGIVLVKAADFAKRFFGDGEGKFTRYASIASALVVTALGVAMTARAFVDVTGFSPFA
ncbi:MAG: nickel/cobalt transporter [Chloroflexota bacterium]